MECASLHRTHGSEPPVARTGPSETDDDGFGGLFMIYTRIMSESSSFAPRTAVAQPSEISARTRPSSASREPRSAWLSTYGLPPQHVERVSEKLEERLTAVLGPGLQYDAS